jgi:RNase H-fold protein (predicted Holliday junction resolvase)
MKFMQLQDFCRKVVQTRSPGKLIALDVGTKHVGLAHTDASRRFVTEGAVKSLKRSSKTDGSEHRLSGPAVTQLGLKLQRIIDKEQACGLVVGIPLKDGDPTPFCKEIVDLMLRLDCTLPTPTPSKTDSSISSSTSTEAAASDRESREMPFTLWDEQYSTMEGRRLVASATSKRSVYLKRKDSIAASVILSKFLAHSEMVPQEEAE